MIVDKLKEGGAELINFDADYWVILNRSAIVVSDTVKLWLMMFSFQESLHS